MSEENDPQETDLTSTKKRALKILGSRYMSKTNMEKRLVSKGESEEAAFETAAWLEDIGAVNDREFADAIVRHYFTKGYGMGRIKDELSKRGIPRDMWDDVLSDLSGFEDNALSFLVKKLKGSSDKNDIRKAMDALLRRGFSYNESHAALSKYNDCKEDVD